MLGKALKSANCIQCDKKASVTLSVIRNLQEDWHPMHIFEINKTNKTYPSVQLYIARNRHIKLSLRTSCLLTANT